MNQNLELSERNWTTAYPPAGTRIVSLSMTFLLTGYMGLIPLYRGLLQRESSQTRSSRLDERKPLLGLYLPYSLNSVARSTDLSVFYGYLMLRRNYGRRRTGALTSTFTDFLGASAPIQLESDILLQDW